MLLVASARADGTPIPHGTVELIAENQSITAGHKLNLGLRFELEKGWHIYWVNPGDSGEPPRVDLAVAGGSRRWHNGVACAAASGGLEHRRFWL